MRTYLTEEFSRSQIAEMIAASFAWDVDSCRRITTGKYNQTYDVALRQNGKSAAPQSVIVRIAPPDGIGGTFYEIGMMAQEPEIHEIVRSETSIPAAEILAHDTSRKVVDRNFLIMEKLPGTALSDISGLSMDFYDPVLEQVGRMLAELHRVTQDLYGYLGAHNCMEPQPDWSSAFRVMWNKLIDDIVAVGAYDDSEADTLRQLHDACSEAFDRPVDASLLHMDIWGQNILVDRDGQVTGLVDWDRALWGDPEIEYAVLDYCGISRPAFWRGYGRSRDTSSEAQIRGLFYYLFEVQKYIVIEIARRNNTAAAAGFKANVFQMIHRAFGE